MKNYKHIDLTYLNGMSGGNIDLIKEMIDIFKLQIPEFVADFDNAISNENWKQIASIAHKAKSSVSIMGIARMANILKEMESIAKQNPDKEKISEMIEDFTITTKEAIEELNSELKNLNEE
jgi:HPt (histidine-containing phosphotransfer) domain-containing protein